VFIGSLQAGAQPTGQASVRQQLSRYFDQQNRVKWISQTALSPDGGTVVWAADGSPGHHTHAIYLAPVAAPGQVRRVSAAAPGRWAYETEPQWRPDGRAIAFLSDARKGQTQICLAPVTGPAAQARILTRLNGHLSHLRWSPDGQYLSVLYVEKASREPSPMAAQNRRVGVIDSLVNTDVQRLALVSAQTGETRLVSPPGLYVYEYDWAPDSRGFAYTAAPAPGDANWYVARLYRQGLASADTTLVHWPAWQIALPRWSPDGRRIAFIEGLMSDQGGTGGDLFVVPAGGGTPRNLTPNRKSSPCWFTWQTDQTLLFTEFVGGSVALGTLEVRSGEARRLRTFAEWIQAGSEVGSLSVARRGDSLHLACIRSSFGLPPDVWAGTPDALRPITRVNAALPLPKPRFDNVEWANDSLRLQGWLLYPAHYDSTRRYPLLVMVHGGPAWVATPTWSAPDFNATLYAQFGYFVFFPNVRGSHGQGQAFTRANRRDWGFGDLRDILSGLDTLTARYPVDARRLGLLGWSYGGFMAMFAPTQTHRFGAVVAGAGGADWLSYFGQNAIDQWMGSYFGASAYADPEAYRRLSPMTYIRQTRTPALVLVGERDGEAPAPQSFQYWHALKTLGVPTQLVVYPDEGHALEDPQNRLDVSWRALAWFERYLK
jgi:dipeptidyl aminopeptidase/acylaminoacyl peptidase